MFTIKSEKKPIRPRWRKVLADLWDGKMRTLLVVASIAVGVFAVGAIISGYVIISEDIDTSFESVNPANIEIWSDPFDGDFVRSVADMPGVESAEGRYVMNVRASQDDETWLSFELLAMDDFTDSKINLIKATDGTAFPGENQIVIAHEPMRNPGYRVGDVIQIELPDGTFRDVAVVGLVRDQAGASDLMRPHRGFIAMDTLEWFGQPVIYNYLVITTSDNSTNPENLQTLAEEIELKIEKSGRQVYRTETNVSNEHPMANMALAVLGVLGALGILVMLLSSSLIFNTLNALLSQHLRQIGVMKLIGARSVQILGMYLLMILSYGFIALALAVPTGAAAGYGLAMLMAYFLNATLSGFRFIPLAVLMQALIALIVPLIAGIVPVKNGSRISVRSAISNDGNAAQPASTSGLVRLGKWFQWLSRPILLSLRNTFRRKGRLALTLFTLTVAGAIFIAVFNTRASMQRYIDQIGEHFMADLSLSFEQPYRTQNVAQAAAQIPGVQDIEAWTGASAEIQNADDELVENVSIVAPPADSSLIDPEILAGRWILPGDQNALAISDSIWDIYPDLQPGDKLRLSVQGKRAEDWTVVGIFRFTNLLGDTLAYADYEYISEILHLPDQSASYRVITEVHDKESQARISKALDLHLRSLGFRVSDVEAGLVTRERGVQAVNIVVMFLLAMALLTAFVGSIGLTGTMGMNVLERTREIGVMRAIGAVDLEIVKSVVVEGLMIGLMSWFSAWLLSYPISFLLLRIISEAMISVPLPLYITPNGTLIWFVAVMLLSATASVLPARNAARLTIREVLAYE